MIAPPSKEPEAFVIRYLIAVIEPGSDRKIDHAILQPNLYSCVKCSCFIIMKLYYIGINRFWIILLFFNSVSKFETASLIGYIFAAIFGKNIATNKIRFITYTRSGNISLYTVFINNPVSHI